MSKEDYNQQKRNLRMSGSLNNGFIPYMFAYYRHKCMETGRTEACTEDQFPEAFKAFLTIPVLRTQTNPDGTVVNTRGQESLKVAVDRVINHFDKLYGTT